MTMTFLDREDGAVTVDWVVLSGAMVALVIAVTSQVGDGMEATSTQVRDIMLTTEIVTSFDMTLADDAFETGRGNWQGGQVLDIPGFGSVLALSGRARAAALEIDVGPNHGYAVIEFDMIVGDSWDGGETADITLGGVDLLEAAHVWNNGSAPSVITFPGENETTVEMTRTETGAGSWNSGSNSDYVYRVRVVAANDGRDLTLGASTTLDMDARDEFFALDNVRVTGTDRPR
jgi:hypothetical protein